MKYRRSYLCDTRTSPARLPGLCPFGKGSSASNFINFGRRQLCYARATGNHGKGFWGYQRDIENTSFIQTYIYRVNDGLTVLYL